ncbi:MAG: TldD/PmbA family protein [Leptospiraceae bacterium]|nr:TldD/PmbA family protein [Leptospiraceae bacterium]MCK6380443.1 TldD/PmbA family protein [Leptospiraceae bacterium]NUM40697.1 TldD/PmbA family protein [Leptospiraceae bacterium]
MNKKELEKKLENTKDRVESVLSKSKQNGISQVEIYVYFSESGEVSLEKNDIHASNFSEETNFGVRVIENYCEGFAATNDPDSLYESILQAKTLAISQNTPDTDLELPNPLPVVPIDGLYDETLDDIDLEEILQLASMCLELRNASYENVNLDSGRFSFYKAFKHVASTKGISQSEISGAITANYMGMAVLGDDIGSFDYDSCESRNLSDFQKILQINYSEFLERCMGFLGSKKIESFRGNILIPPESIFSFLGDVIGSMTAGMIRKGKSKLKDKLGKKVFSSLLSVVEEPRISGFAGSTAFDREGIPTIPKEVIAEGIVKNFFYNHYEAKKAGLKGSGGNAVGGSSAPPSCGPRQLQVSAGKTALGDILKPTQATIQIGRISGSSDISSGEFSGVVKGGYFLKGTEKFPVKELTVSGNIYDALERISHVSKERKLIHSSSYRPHIVIEGMDITGK